MKDDSTYLNALINEGEHQHQDFKFEISNSRKIAKTLVAFANTDGGRLLIGVKDNGRITGIRSEEEFYMIEAAATMYCRPEVTFETYHRVSEGRTVLEIIVPVSELKPHYAEEEPGKWRAYHRVNDNNFLVDFIQLQVWKREKRKTGTFIEYSEKEKAVLDALERSGTADLNSIRTMTGMKKRELQYLITNLICLEAVEMVFLEHLVSFRLTGE